MVWQRLSTETINQNPWTEFRHDRFRMENGKEGDYFYLHTPGSVLIIPIQADGRIVLHRQYRYLFDRDSLEFPGGGIKSGQTPEQAIAAELAEEVGLQAKQIRRIGGLAPANGVFDELEHVYLAWDFEVVPAAPEETENFILEYLTPAEIDAKIASNELWDGFSVGPWALAKPHVLTLIEQIKESV